MKSIFDHWYDENYQKHLKHHAAYWKCKQTWLAAQKQQLEELEQLRQRVQELEKELEDFESDIDTCTQHNVELQLEVIKLTAERDELLSEIEKMLTYCVIKTHPDFMHQGKDWEAHMYEAIASVKEKQNERTM